MFNKLIAGSNYRRTRLHDEKGNFVGWRRLILHAPLALATGILRLLLGYRVSMPWIAYDSINIIRQHLNTSSRVLEFGSGMSTFWYSKHAGTVCSVDDYKPWFDLVGTRLKKLNISNVDYRFLPNRHDYSSFMQGDLDGFDLIMIDGSYRSECIKKACGMLKQGGILYLDNSDMDSSGQGGDMRLAEKYALDFACANNAAITYVTDFAPTQLFAQQGLLLRLPKIRPRPFPLD